MLKITDLNSQVPEVESQFNFPLDPFQKHAIYAISKDENVLVTAKTGSGKTLVGEFQIYHSLKKGKRVFYTTPIKSLSNQKFHDLKKMFPSVGIMTGDIKFMPQADVVIMTTEILRNLLYKQGTSTESVGVTANLSMDNVDSVIFDEVHYINDTDRGKVWEECLTLLKPEINLVLLSATIENPERFANWLGDIKKKPIHLISTSYRIVPLSHQLPDGTIVMDAKEQFNKKAYATWYDKYYEMERKERIHRDNVRSREEGQDVVKRDERTTSFVDRMNKLIAVMELPALFFVFSRKLSRTLANKVSHNLLDSSDTASVKHIMSFHLHRYPELMVSSQYHELCGLLEKGIAYHHSGMLPVMKEIIEILFSRGFVKVLFATETFAVGINMPTKSVVFTSYRKYDDKLDCHKMLSTSEYIQMAGRAGRRGKDDKGIVIYLPYRDPETPFEVQSMMTGKKAVLNSQMDFHYSYILSAMLSGKNILQDTYWVQEQKEGAYLLKHQIVEKRQQIVDFDERTIEQLMTRDSIEKLFKQSGNAEKKKWQAELSRWKNSHMSPKWDTMYSQFKVNEQLVHSIHTLEEAIIDLYDFERTINIRKEVLKEHGFLDNESLTQKGILASEVHEGHPLIIPMVFTDKVLHDKSADEIIECLSVFLEDVRIDEYIQRIPFHLTADSYAKKIVDSEILKIDFSYWTFTSYWAEVVRRWITGEDYVCNELNIEEGNFVRAMLKLSNIVEEWINMAILSQDVEMVEKMKGAKNRIVRGFVIPDSLYLRI